MAATTDAKRPRPTAGLRHVALHVRNLEATVAFYTDLLGMAIEWQPDEDNYYLSSGIDNLALHRAKTAPDGNGQRLDHIGFIVDGMDDVDAWHAFLSERGTPILKPPKTHRDGARSCYCADPEGTTVQILYHPPLSRDPAG